MIAESPTMSLCGITVYKKSVRKIAEKGDARLCICTEWNGHLHPFLLTAEQARLVTTLDGISTISHYKAAETLGLSNRELVARVRVEIPEIYWSSGPACTCARRADGSLDTPRAEHLPVCPRKGYRSGPRGADKRADRRKAGLHPVETWFPADELAHLNSLAAVRGSRSAVIRSAVARYTAEMALEDKSTDPR